jgi:hypothetical protein
VLLENFVRTRGIGLRRGASRLNRDKGMCKNETVHSAGLMEVGVGSERLTGRSEIRAMKSRRPYSCATSRRLVTCAVLSLAGFACQEKSADRMPIADSPIAMPPKRVADSAAAVLAAIALVRTPSPESFRVIRFERTDSGFVVDLVPSALSLGGGGRVLVPSAGAPRLLLPYR